MQESRVIRAEHSENSSAMIADEFNELKLSLFRPEAEILIIDDDSGLVYAISTYLSDNGFGCETAASAAEAMDKLHSNPDICVLLTDIRMPGMNGLEMVRRVKEKYLDTRFVEVIYMTGHGGRTEAVEALQLGALDFLTKPVSLKLVLHSVQRAAEMARLRSLERNYESMLQAALEKQQELNALLRVFIEMASEELTEPLAVIDGTAHAVLEQSGHIEPAELAVRMKQLRGNVTQMRELIQRATIASSINAGTIELELVACDLAGLLREVCESHSVLDSAHRFDLVLDDLPQPFSADTALLRHVFMCLLSNTFKYTKGPVYVEVKAWTEDDSVCVAIKDHGVDVPFDQIQQLLDRPYDALSGDSICGAGIGLNLIWRLVDMHNGTLSCDRNTGGPGCTFNVRLPA